MPRLAAEPATARIGAGVLHYRAWPGVQDTLDALLAQTRAPDEVLVLDHASRDGSADRIRAAYPQVEVLELPENHGPAGGMAQLLLELLKRDVEAIFVLPDDIELAPGALEQLAARLDQDPEVGAVGPLVAHRRARERIFCAGGYLDSRTWDLEYRDQPPKLEDWVGKPPQTVDFLGLGGILMRSEAVRAAMPFAAHFYHGLDDIDFTLRLASLGWRLECVPAAVVWQDLGDRRRDTLMVEPSPYLVTRNHLGLIASTAPRRILARELLRVVSWLIRDGIRPRGGSRASLTPRLRGLIDFCRGRWGAPP